jgi:hypothetical protein
LQVVDEGIKETLPEPQALVPLLNPLTIQHSNPRLNFVRHKSSLRRRVVEMPDYLPAGQLQMITLDMPPQVLGYPVTAQAQ